MCVKRTSSLARKTSEALTRSAMLKKLASLWGKTEAESAHTPALAPKASAAGWAVFPELVPEEGSRLRATRILACIDVQL